LGRLSKKWGGHTAIKREQRVSLLPKAKKKNFSNLTIKAMSLQVLAIQRRKDVGGQERGRTGRRESEEKNMGKNKQ